MTASELHQLRTEPEPYGGGFTTKDNFGHDAVELHIVGDEGGVHLHQHVSAGVGGGSMGAYSRLSPGEARELSLALDRAADAAENFNERNAS